MVHRRTDCATNAEARQRVDGLGILAVMIEVSDDAKTSPFLQHLMTATQHALYKGEHYEDAEAEFNPYDILLNDGGELQVLLKMKNPLNSPK